MASAQHAIISKEALETKLREKCLCVSIVKNAKCATQKINYRKREKQLTLTISMP